MKQISIALLGALIFLGLGSCNKTDLKDFESNRNKWEALDDSDYNFDLILICFCIHASSAPVRVIVENNKVTGILDPITGLDLIDQNDSTLIFDKFGTYYPTIDGIFDEIERSINDNAFKTEVTYHSSQGYPEEVFLDGSENIADDEISYTVVAVDLN